MGANDYAIVVGINKYPALGDLVGPEADARDFHAWLIDPQGGGVPEANVTLLLSSNYPAAAQLKSKPQVSDIEAVFDDYVVKGRDEGSVGDRLYLYFAGHGFAPSLEDAALLMANASRGMTGYHIPGRKYANWFRQAAFFKEVVLFMDCCRENYALSAMRNVPYDPMSGDPPATAFFAFATQWSRAAREGPWGDGGAMRGLFTLALLAGLRGGAARNANGQITGDALQSFVFNFVRKKFTEGSDQEEHPDPEFFYDAMKPVVFGAPDVPGAAVPLAAAEAYSVRIAIQNGDAGKKLTLSTNGKPEIAPALQQPNRWEWHLDTAGLYKVTRSDGKSKLFEVIGEKKEAIDVSFD